MYITFEYFARQAARAESDAEPRDDPRDRRAHVLLPDGRSRDGLRRAAHRYHLGVLTAVLIHYMTTRTVFTILNSLYEYEYADTRTDKQNFK